MGKIASMGADSNRKTTVKLTDAERRVWDLHCQGLKPTEIAKQLGYAANGIYSKLAVAKEKMQAAGWQ